jgi:hypothetical protein
MADARSDNPSTIRYPIDAPPRQAAPSELRIADRPAAASPACRSDSGSYLVANSRVISALGAEQIGRCPGTGRRGHLIASLQRRRAVAALSV